MRQDVIDYCKADRQWKREQRLAYARTQFQAAKTADKKDFWDLVMRVNMLTSSVRLPID